MAKSLLRQQIERTAPTGDLGWDKVAAAVEVLVTALGAISVSIDPGAVNIGAVTANAGTNLNTSALATQTTLASILTKLADPATQTTLAAILAKQPTAPALETGGNLATIAGKDFATQTTLAAILSKLLVAPATEAKQDTQVTSLATLHTDLTTTLHADLTAATPAGTNNIGKVSPPTATLAASTAYATNKVLKGSAGVLISLSGYNSGPSQFIQIHDAATLPAEGSVPIKIFYVPSGSSFSTDIPITGLPCATGIVVCNSSTGPTKTIGSGDCFFTGVVI